MRLPSLFVLGFTLSGAVLAHPHHAAEVEAVKPMEAIRLHQLATCQSRVPEQAEALETAFRQWVIRENAPLKELTRLQSQQLNAAIIELLGREDNELRDEALIRVALLHRAPSHSLLDTLEPLAGMNDAAIVPWCQQLLNTMQHGPDEELAAALEHARTLK